MKRYVVYLVLAFTSIFTLVSCSKGTANDYDLATQDAEAEFMIQIVIDYEKSSFSYNDDATIYIDDTEIGSISAGESDSCQISVKTGQHYIQAKGGTAIRHNNSSTVEFTVDATTKVIGFALSDKAITGLTLSLSHIDSELDERENEQNVDSNKDTITSLFQDIEGEWQDSWSERCSMTITNERNDYYSVDVMWASSASEYDNWVFGGYYDYSSGTLSYDQGNWYSYVDDGTGSIQECWILDNMEGCLYLDGNYLFWDDYTASSMGYDFGASNMKFERIS